MIAYKPWFSWVVLLDMCLCGFGSMFCTEFPFSLQEQFENDMNMTGTQYMNLTTFLSLPNIIFSLCGGIIVASLGRNKSVILFSLITVFGQGILILGIFTNVLPVVYIGRMINGVGAEILMIVNYMFIAHWFNASFFNFAFALTVSMARIGSTLAVKYGLSIYLFVKDLRTPTFPVPINSTLNAAIIQPNNTESGINLGFTFLVSLVPLISSTLLAVVVVYLPDSDYGTTEERESLVDTQEASSSQSKPRTSIAKRSLNIKASLERPSRNISIYGSRQHIVEKESRESSMPSLKNFRFNHRISADSVKAILTYIPCATWITIITCSTLYQATEPWIAQAAKFFKVYHHVQDDSKTHTLATLLNLTGVIGAPLFGLIIDKVKSNAVWTLFGAFVSLLGHGILLVENQAYGILILGNIFLGLGYSMFACSIWILMTYTISTHKEPIAYGLMQSCQHVGFMVASAVIGNIQDKHKNDPTMYVFSEIYMLIVLGLGACSLILFIVFYGAGSQKLTRKDNRCCIQALVSDATENDEPDTTITTFESSRRW